MIFDPFILAILTGSAVSMFFTLHSAFFGQKVIRTWDRACGEESQIKLEKGAYLASTQMSITSFILIISLFLFISEADALHVHFTGAMCAAGTLYANNYGYPALISKIFSAILSAIWLVINRVDNNGYDYPLIKQKYLFLLFIAPVILADSALTLMYFNNLDASVITSCCGSLFSSEYAVPPDLSAIIFTDSAVTYLCILGAAIVIGAVSFYISEAAWGLTVLSATLLPFSIISLISIISVAIYELPTHQCPFDILQAEYNHIGYPIYISIFIGVVTGVTAGLLNLWKSIDSISVYVVKLQRNLIISSTAGWIVLMLISAYHLAFTHLTR